MDTENQVLHVFLLGGNGPLVMLTSSGTPHWILLILAAVHTYFAVTGKGLLFMALLWHKSESVSTQFRTIALEALLLNSCLT